MSYYLSQTRYLTPICIDRKELTYYISDASWLSP